MKRNSKIILAIFVALVIIAVPLYVYTRPQAPVEGTVLQIRGASANPINLTLTQLNSYTATTVQVTLSSSSRHQDNGVFKYTGVSLAELLQQIQIHQNVTSFYVQASDGYGTTIPSIDALDSNTIIAIQRNGSYLTPLTDGGEGPLRLIIGNDEFAQRWIRGVTAIEVR